MIRMPRVIRTMAQRQRVREMVFELHHYCMRLGHDVITHIKIVNKMIKELIHAGYFMSELLRTITLLTTMSEP